MSRLLVTGAAGFIGSHLCEALLAAGHDVAGLDNFDPFYARAVKERNLAALRGRQGFRFAESDLVRDPLPLEGVEAIIHLAARPGVQPSLEDPASYMETNVTGTAPRSISKRARSDSLAILAATRCAGLSHSVMAPLAER